MSNPTPGLTGEARLTVTDDLTAAAIGSGLVAVFSTPMLVALLESAAVQALSGMLESDQTSVGTRVDVQHLAATPVGVEVWAKATLKEVDGRRLVFEVEAWDDAEKIGQAVHERFIVHKERFEARAARKRSAG